MGCGSSFPEGDLLTWFSFLDGWVGGHSLIMGRQRLRVVKGQIYSLHLRVKTCVCSIAVPVE